MIRSCLIKCSFSTLPSPLRNTFFGLRHGNSEANAAGIISSNPEVATKIHGLTALGIEQAEESAAKFISTLNFR